MRDRIAQHAPPKSPWDFSTAGRPVRRRLHRPCLALRHAATLPDILHPHPPTGAAPRRRAGLIDHADAATLCATRLLMSDVQSLLRLTLNGDESSFDEAKAPEGQRRLIAQTLDVPTRGAADDTDAEAAAARRPIYVRIVETPARRGLATEERA